MKKIIFTFILSTAIVLSGFGQQATATKKELKEEKKEFKKIKEEQQAIIDIETPNFTFYPSTVTPEFGLTRYLNIAADNLYLQVSKTDVSANLPFIGQFYIEPVEPYEVPLSFYSKKFTYSVNTTDGVNFQMQLVPTDLMTVMNKGLVINFKFNKDTRVGTVTIQTENRTEVTYTGYFQ